MIEVTCIPEVERIEGFPADNPTSEFAESVADSWWKLTQKQRK